MADRIQQRRDTKARWEQFNPVLLEGEAGYVLDDVNRYKIGDGIHAWNDLPYRGFDGTIVHDIGDSENAVMSQKAVSKKFTELGSKVSDLETVISEGEKSVYAKYSTTAYSIPVKIKKGTKYSVEVIADNVLSSTETTPLYVNDTSGNPKNITNGSSFTSIANEDINSFIIYTREAAFINSGYVTLKIKNNYIAQRLDSIDEEINKIKVRSFVGSFVGQNTEYVSTDHTSLKPLNKYRVYLNRTSWNTPTIDDGLLLFGVSSLDENDNSIRLVSGYVGDTILDYYDFVVPSDSKTVRIGGRASVGEEIKYSIIDITEISPMIEDNKLFNLVSSLFDAQYTEREIIQYGTTYSFPCSLNSGGRYKIQLKADGVISDDESLGGVPLYYNDTSHLINNISNNGIVEFSPEDDVHSIIIYVRQPSFISKGIVGLFIYNYSSSLETDSILIDSFVSAYNNTDIESKSREFAELYKETNDKVEPFVYFTDAHILTADISELEMKKSMSLVEKYYNSIAANFVLCGGDWYNSDILNDALYKLSYIDGFLKKLFKKHYPIFGNHDNNYQGKLDENSEARTGTISDQTMINLMYREWGKKYYSFSGTSTKFYIFDSGIDWETEMNDYRWEQLDWFAKELIEKDDEHNVAAMHIVCNQGTVETWDTYVTPLADNLTLLMDAYNKKDTIILNGVNYDFSKTKGKCHCILCGHTHYDNIAKRNNIPIFCTTQFKYNYTGTTTFDLIILDYGNNKLKSVRVGVGENREMELA